MSSSCNQNPPWDPTKGYSLHHVNPTGVWTIPQWSWMEFLVPLRSVASEGAFNNLWARINPELGVVAYPSTTAFVKSEIIFRDGMEGMTLYLDLCTIPHTLYCGQ
jgi:hypothetical protein